METFVADLAAAQRAAGCDVHVLVHGDPQADDPPWLQRVPVQAHLSYAPLAAGFRRALRRQIDAFEPDLLHLHMPNNAVFWALTLTSARGLPWVVHWHSDVVQSRHRLSLALGYALYRPFEQAVLAHAERVVVTSPDYLEASEPLQRWHHKCAAIPLGLAVPPASPAPAAAAAEPSPWQPGRLRLLSIGRLAYYKDFATLIRASAAVPGAQLVIAGDGELRDDLQRLVDGLPAPGGVPAVRLLGPVSDEHKQQLLRECELFCLASCERTEAFGLVLLEAMQQGRPCLVTELPGSGMPWVVREAGAGWTAPVGAVDAWRDAIARIGAQPQERAERGAAGRRAFDGRFSIAACERLLAGHYRTLVAQPRQPGSPDRILVVIPARDEVTTIGVIVRELHDAGWRHVLVVDDHSEDGTGDAARAAGANVVRGVLPMGAWGALQTGFRYAAAHGFHAVITMDADGQHETQEIPALLAASSSCDVVIGAFPERASQLRQLAWKWFRQLAGFDLRDLTSGFRFYSGKAIDILASEEATLLDYQDIGILLLLRRAGLTIQEVPVTMAERTSGKSRIFSSWFRVGRYMALTTLLCLARWEARRHRAVA